MKNKAVGLCSSSIPSFASVQKLLILFLVAAWVSPATRAQHTIPAPTFFPAAPLSASGARLVEAGPHHCVFEAPAATNGVSANSPFSQPTSGFSKPSVAFSKRRITSVASGMNYWDGVQWSPSQSRFEVRSNYFVSDKTYCRVQLAPDLNTVGAVTASTPDGTTLVSTPIAVAIYSPSTGEQQVIGTITNSAGVLSSTNVVTYENAFSGISASLVYRIERGSFHQDLVLTAALDPSAYGFGSDSRIEVISEFYGGASPQTVTNSARSGNAPDTTPSFGVMTFGAGRAFSAANGQTNAVVSAPVAKQFISTSPDSRQFLIESVEAAAIKRALQALPASGLHSRATGKKYRSRQSFYASIPRPSIPNPPNRAATVRERPAADPTLDPRPSPLTASTIPNPSSTIHHPSSLPSLASASPRPSPHDPRPSVTIDYIVTLPVDSAIYGPFTFQSDLTYFIAGPTYFFDTVTLEATVIKFADQYQYGENAFIQINGPLIVKARSFWPAVLTSGNDDSIGISLQYLDPVWQGYTGTPTVPTDTAYASPALWFPYSDTGVNLSNVRFSYIPVCIQADICWNLNVSHSQFVNCACGVLFGWTDGNVRINNCLFSNVGIPLYEEESDLNTWAMCNCTLDGCNQILQASGTYINSVNSIFSNVGDTSSGGSGNYNAFYNSTPFGDNCQTANNSPFQQIGPAHYFLADDTFRNQGPTAGMDSAVLHELRLRTTRPPKVLDTGLLLATNLSLPPLNLSDSGPNVDLGFHYPKADYSVSWIFLTGGSLNICPGTSILMRRGPDTAPAPWMSGGRPGLAFVLWEGSTLVSHGTPDRPIIFADDRFVGETPDSTAAGTRTLIASDYEGQYWLDAPPDLSFRFCDFFLPPDDPLMVSGQDTINTGNWRTFFPGPEACLFWSLQDCSVHGGFIDLMPNLSLVFSRPGSISWNNSVFERVWSFVLPNAYPLFFDTDTSFHAHNNLAIGGLFYFWSNPSAQGEWEIKDNLFDQVQFFTVSQPLDHDYNAYCLYQGPFFPFSSTSSATNRLIYDYNHLDQFAPHDKILTQSPAYVPGPFGQFYLQDDSGTATYTALAGTASRTMRQAGLAQYTSWTDQTLDGNTTRSLDVPGNIGLHWPRADLNTGSPQCSLVATVPDYVADADGDALVDSLQPQALATTLSPVTKANYDVFQVQQDSSPNSLAVRANDSDSRGLPLSIFFPAFQTTTPHGSVLPSPDGRTLLYTPASGFFGADTFTYAIVNDFSAESSATCTVFVNKTHNTAPVAVDHTVLLTSGETSRAINLLDDCHDPDSDTVTLSSVGRPAFGSIVSQSGGQITYALSTSLAGPDSFRYVITDGKGGMASATVQITRDTGGNHAPVAVSYSTTAQKNNALNLTLVASDADNDPLTYSINQPAHGHVTGTGPAVVYTPNTGYIGPDSFSFTVSDGALSSLPGTILIRVQADNNAPYAFPDSYRTTIETPVAITLQGWDPDGDYLTYAISQFPANGSLTGTAPNLIYTPGSGFEGYDSFTFTVSDGKATPSSVSTATVQIQVVRQQIFTLESDQQNFTFRKDLTYYVTKPVTLSGTTTIEGGAVVKMARQDIFSPSPPAPAKLIFNGQVNCNASEYAPFIVSVEDDDSVGATIPTSFGAPDLFLSSYGWIYADVALQLPAGSFSNFKFVRVEFANVGIHYAGNSGSDFTTGALNHSQFLFCNYGLWAEGNSSRPCLLFITNCLFSLMNQVLKGSVFGADLRFCTVNYCGALAPDPATPSFVIHSSDSIYARLAGLEVNLPAGDGQIQGNLNGFDATSPQFGSNPILDPGWPFAPNGTSGTLATLEGGSYMRDGSPFIGVGESVVGLGLAADFATMTTTAPRLLTQDIVSSQTITPVVPRENPAAPSLGYHYPAADYFVNGATVNNCTLNIDQGTVLAFAPWNYEWGLRLNPGARLNVNGVPTNRVTFARIESIQEMLYPDPFFPFGFPYPSGPLITFKGVFLPSPNQTMVTPLPEARFHYADFFAPAGDPVHIGPLTQESPSTYDCVAALELNGCDFQAGQVAYEAGGPQGRTVNIHNTIFERTLVSAVDHFQTHGNNEETLTAFNNLFYGCDMWLTPVSGANWTFTDNIFHSSVFHGPQPYHGTGPVTQNKNNAYVDMHGARLSPNTQATTDKILDALNYDYGPLGTFYLPAADTTPSLRRAGSRTASLAGLFHFTSFVAENLEQSNNVVNIGPAYLGLVNGFPSDYNHDGVPDVIADRNGDGIEDADEMPWSSANNNGLRILDPVEGAQLSGLVRLRVNLGTNGPGTTYLQPILDGTSIPDSAFTINPAQSLAEIEFNSAYVTNGPHALSLVSWQQYTPVETADDVNVTITNALSWPEWTSKWATALDVELQGPASSTNFALYFYGSGYPKAYAPQAAGQYAGSLADGAISYNDTLQNVGISSSDSHIYTFLDLSPNSPASSSAPAVAAPAASQPAPFPGTGLWAVSYTANTADWDPSKAGTTNPIEVLDPVDIGSSRWCHDNRLGTWWFCGLLQGTTTLAFPPQGTNAQTYPLRIVGLDVALPKDRTLLLNILSDPNVVNYYGLGHGDPLKFMGIQRNSYEESIQRRFRFAFLDGCNVELLKDFLKVFGADDRELATNVFLRDQWYRSTNTNPNLRLRPAAFLGWQVFVPLTYDMSQTMIDPTTGKTCLSRHFETLCNWHRQLIARWALDGEPLSQAIDDATAGALVSPNNSFPRDITPPYGWYDIRVLSVKAATLIPFVPDSTCLRMVGDGDLHFSGNLSYNTLGDWTH